MITLVTKVQTVLGTFENPPEIEDCALEEGIDGFVDNLRQEWLDSKPANLSDPKFAIWLIEEKGWVEVRDPPIVIFV
jgi:hypothetical protein